MSWHPPHPEFYGRGPPPPTGPPPGGGGGGGGGGGPPPRREGKPCFILGSRISVDAQIFHRLSFFFDFVRATSPIWFGCVWSTSGHKFQTSFKKSFCDRDSVSRVSFRGMHCLPSANLSGALDYSFLLPKVSVFTLPHANFPNDVGGTHEYIMKFSSVSRLELFSSLLYLDNQWAFIVAYLHSKNGFALEF